MVSTTSYSPTVNNTVHSASVCNSTRPYASPTRQVFTYSPLFARQTWGGRPRHCRDRTCALLATNLYRLPRPWQLPLQEMPWSRCFEPPPRLTSCTYVRVLCNYAARRSVVRAVHPLVKESWLCVRHPHPARYRTAYREHTDCATVNTDRSCLGICHALRKSLSLFYLCFRVSWIYAVLPLKL